MTKDVPRDLMRVDEFSDWLDGAAPGTRIQYYRGYLARDLELSHPLRDLARATLAASQRSHVILVQRRHAENDYAYLAIRSAG